MQNCSMLKPGDSSQSPLLLLLLLLLCLCAIVLTTVAKPAPEPAPEPAPGELNSAYCYVMLCYVPLVGSCFTAV
jgi:hypothetical protein